MQSFQDAWGAICEYCKTHISHVAYNVWIAPIEPVDLNGNEATLSIPSSFQKKIIEENYMSLLSKAFEEVFGLKIKIKMSAKEESDIVPDPPVQKNPETAAEYDLTFDTFIVGSSNKFAHAASQAVAANPAGAYNPLFIYGGSGLGKTHLLYAIRKEVEKNNPKINVVYIKGDDFTVGLIEAIRDGKTDSFRKKYRRAEVFLVDDIQFIAGKERTQEEFFHTFNTLYESKKQIVLTSDRPPKEIGTLEERLRTRFESGLLADVQPPDFETRVAIIKRKADLLNATVPDDVSEYISNRLKNNIRQLEGTVIKLIANHRVTGNPISIFTAQDAIRDFLINDKPVPATIEKILEEVARTFAVSVEDLRSVKRSQKISSSRQIAMYIMREVTQITMDLIGKEFGGRDHSTVVYAIRHAEEKIKKDSSLRATIEDIIKNIKNNS